MAQIHMHYNGRRYSDELRQKRSEERWGWVLCGVVLAGSWALGGASGCFLALVGMILVGGVLAVGSWLNGD